MPSVVSSTLNCGRTGLRPAAPVVAVSGLFAARFHLPVPESLETTWPSRCSGLREEIMQRLDPDDRRRQRGGNLRVAHVADVRYALDLKVVNLGMEGALDQGRGAAEADGHAVVADLGHGKPAAGEPIGNRGNVGLRRPEVRAHFRRLEPLMEVRRLRSRTGRQRTCRTRPAAPGLG
jgi:hypothetical protein